MVNNKKYIPQTTEEKALFYLHHVVLMFYGFRGISAFSIVGIIGLVMIIIEKHFSYRYFLSIVIGLIIAFLNINFRVSIAARKPKIYEEAFEWEKTAYYLRFGDDSLTANKIKVFSLKGIQLGIKNFFTAIIYESYKWILVLFVLAFSIFLSISAGGAEGAALFNIGLAMTSWGGGYFVLWSKKYFKVTADKLCLTNDQYTAIRDFYKQ